MEQKSSHLVTLHRPKLHKRYNLVKIAILRFGRAKIQKCLRSLHETPAINVSNQFFIGTKLVEIFTGKVFNSPFGHVC